MKWFRKILQGIGEAGSVAANEIKVILHDPGAMLFFFALPLMYPIVYTLIYNPEVVEKVSVAVVDDSRSAESRTLVRDASASPGIEIYGYAANMSEAREWMNERKVFGIMHIPYDYGQKIGSGQQANVSFYSNMALLLRYRTLLMSLTSLQIKLVSDITAEKVESVGAESLRIGMPIGQEAHYLGDSEQGFASFVIPGIIILILQQSMLLGICLIEGTSNERRRLNPFHRDYKMVWWASPGATVAGKAAVYVMIYLPLTIYVTRFIPWMFHLPHNGDPVQYMIFMLPMLVASAMLGLALAPLMKDRESSFLALVVTSVFFLFLSGLTWPRFAMSGLWSAVGDAVPATWGVEGFIRINSNGATLAENSHPWAMLWLLAGIYCVIAIALRYWRAHRYASPLGRPA